MPRGRPATLDRDEALPRLTRAVWTAGPDVGLDALAAELGVTKPTLCRTFGARGDILAAAFAAYDDLYGAEAIARIKAAPDLAAAVAGMLAVTVERAADPDLPRGCLATDLVARAPEVGPLAEAIAPRRDAVLAALRARIAAERPADQVEPTLRWLLAQQGALVALSRMGANTQEMEASATRVVDGL